MYILKTSTSFICNIDSVSLRLLRAMASIPASVSSILYGQQPQSTIRLVSKVSAD